MDRANLSRVGLIFTDLRFDGFDSEVELGVIDEDELIAATYCQLLLLLSLLIKEHCMHK